MTASPAGASVDEPRAFWRNAALVTGGTAFAQALALAATPALTRLYSPTDFGAFAVYMGVLLIAASCASLRYEYAIPLPSEQAVAAALLVTALCVVAASSCLVAVATLVLGDALIEATDAESLQPYLWLVPLGVAGTGVYQVLTYWAIREKAFGRLARTRMVQGGSMVGIQVGAGAAGAGAIGLMAGALVGQVAGSGRLALEALRAYRRAPFALTRSLLRSSATRYRRFPLLSTPSGLANSLGVYLPAILLAAFYGPAVAGLFALTQRAINLPLILVGNSVAQAYTGEAASLLREDPRRLRRLFDSTARSMLLLGAVPAVAAVIAAPWLFELVFGDEWRQSGEFVQVLALMFLLQFVSLPLSQTLNVLERLGTQLAYDVVRLILGVGALATAHALGAGPVEAVAAYGAGMTVAFGANILINARAVRRRVRD